MIRREYENLQKRAKKPKNLPIQELDQEEPTENEARYLEMLEVNDITESPAPAKLKKL